MIQQNETGAAVNWTETGKNNRGKGCGCHVRVRWNEIQGNPEDRGKEKIVWVHRMLHRMGIRLRS